MYLYGRKIAYKQRQEDNDKFYGAATGEEKKSQRFVFHYVSHTRLVSVALWICTSANFKILPMVTKLQIKTSVIHHDGEHFYK